MNTAYDRDAPADDDPPHSLLWLPAQLVLDVVHAAWRSFRPYLPQLVPLLVFLITIPILAASSVSAGWYVWRSIAVGWETALYLQYGDGISPYAQADLSFLATQQPYDVSLHLVLPTTPSNLDLGNFMTTLTLSTPSNQTIASVRRPALVHPPRNLPWSLLLGKPTTTTLDIPLLSNLLFHTPDASASVQIGRRDHWKSLGHGEGRELTVSSALLRGVVVHKGIRGILTRFPLLTALSASVSFFFISFVALASCLLPMIEWRLQGYSDPPPFERDAYPQQQSQQQQQRRVKREASVPATPRAPRQKRSRSLGTPRSLPSVKAEESVVPIPSSVSETPLRRRRSRLSQPGDE